VDRQTDDRVYKHIENPRIPPTDRQHTRALHVDRQTDDRVYEHIENPRIPPTYD